ncbi:MAG TPA: lysylphosphatidylglycerol synthase transmembrane domain-containing protein [Candidatus Bathyarchaeia archaeon]|nr:lysylphosphatidylglycerol synthase transmembrane domain-containing protein [Candidatus Bathyarchaeia archaeon]
MKRFLNNGVVSFVLRLGLSVGLLWFVLRGIQFKELVGLFKTADVIYIWYAFIPFVVIHGLLLVRWRIFIHALGLNVPWINMTRYFFLGLFGNLFLPTAIGGDVIKTVGLCGNAQEKPKVVASVLLDRLSGFASMVVVACVAIVFGFRFLNNPLIWKMVLAMGAGLVFLGAVLFHEPLYRFCCQAFSLFPKVQTALMQMHYDIALLKDRKIAIVKAIGVSCVSQLLLAMTFFLLAKALRQDVPIFYFVIFTPITCVASSFPSVGGLGFREAGLEFLLGSVAAIMVADGIGVSVGLLDFFFMVVVGVAGWIFFVMTKNQGGAR